MKTVAWILIIGAINVGLSAFGFNVIEMILQPGSILTRAAYIIIGLAGVYKLYVLVGGGKK